jgi:hypothetical protein
MSQFNQPHEKMYRRALRVERKNNPYVAPPSQLLNHDQRRAFKAAMRRAGKGENLSDRTDALVKRYVAVGLAGVPS